MRKLNVTLEAHESDEYGDVTFRFRTDRGSTPVNIVEDGKINDAEKIGNQMLALFGYFVQSEIYDNIKLETK